MWQHSTPARVSPIEQHAPGAADSETINRLIIDNAVVGILMINRDRQWTRTNSALCTMLGYTEAELFELEFTSITHADDLEQDFAHLNRLLLGEITQYSREKRLVRKDGSAFWVRVHVAGVYDDTGCITHFVAQVLDIDAERVALAQRSALQQQMQAFLEYVPAYITMTDVDGRYTAVNGKLAQALNLEPDELIGQTVGAVGLSEPAAEQVLDDERHILRTGEIIERESRAPWDPDCTVWITRFPMLDADGEIVGTGSIATDITESKRQEQERLAQARTIGLLQRLAVAVKEAEHYEAAMDQCLELICRYMDWPFGHVSRPGADDHLESAGIWYADNNFKPIEFRAKREEILYPAGIGVPGRAWASKRPQVQNGSQESLQLTPEIVANPIAFPIIVETNVVAIFECYSTQPIMLNEGLFDVLAFVNTQIGYAIERDRAIKASARALEQLAYHIDNAAVGVVEVDSDLRFLAWSPKCEELFGWRAEEVIGKRFNEINFIHPDDLHLVSEVEGQLDDPEFTVCSLFYRNITKSGQILHIDWYGSILRDAHGALVSSLAIAVDRTAEVVAQQALREERNLFVAGPAMVFRWRDEPGYPIEYVSPNVKAIAGCDQEDFVSIEVVSSRLVHPEDREKFQHELRDFRLSGEARWTVEPFRILTDSGTTIWLRIYASRIFNDSGPDHFVAYAVDITRTYELQNEARLHTERLHYVIDGTDAGTWEWDIVTGDIVINERWAEIIGYTVDELEPTNVESWKRLIHPDDLLRAMELLDQHLDGDLNAYDLDARMRHKDGHWVWVHNRGKVFARSSNGRPLRVAGTHIDITQRKRDEAELLAANEALVKSNAELEQFAYVASHDLQEPLRMVASFTKLLERNYADELDDKAREYINYAADGAQRMQQLIKDLLSYSRIGRGFIDDTVVDMNTLLERITRSLQLSIGEASAQVVCGTLPMVRGDPSQLQQLLQNLVANAVKYRGEKASEIVVGIEQRKTEDVFFVRDNGMGLDPKYRDRIFEIFQRLHARAAYPGTGIGLAICKRIVERHGGRIWVESTPGEGATFFFTLSADRISSAETEPRERMCSA